MGGASASHKSELVKISERELLFVSSSVDPPTDGTSTLTDAIERLGTVPLE